VRAAAEAADWNRQAAEAQALGQPAPPAPKAGGIYRSALQLGSRTSGGPTVNLLTRDQSVNWFFKTREGAAGVLQLVSFTDDPPAAKIRYRLLLPTNDPGVAISQATKKSLRETLGDRLEAASMMNSNSARDKSLATVAGDAAKAGEVEILENSLRQISSVSLRNQTTLSCARALAKRGLRKQAIQMASSMDDTTLRDQALSELAQ